MKRLTLQDLGVTEMDAKQLAMVNGGIDWAGFLKGSAVSFIATQVISHWAEVKAGFVDGYNAKI